MPIPTITPLPPAPSRIDDDPAQFASKANAFMAAMEVLPVEINAATAAITAATTAIDFAATSTTSLTIGTGSKTLTIQTGKPFQIGQFVLVASTASPQNYMLGQITAYNATTGALTVNVPVSGGAGGTGTFTSWTIALTAPSGGGAYVLTTGATMTGTLNLPSNGLTVGASQLIVTGGKVGIGTAAPGSELEVSDTGGDNDVRVTLRANGTTTSQVGASSALTFIDSIGNRPFVVNVNGAERFRVGATGITTALAIESTSGGFKFPDGTTQLTAAGGWTEIATIATTSGSSITFSSIPSAYSDLLLVFAGVSDVANCNLGMALSPDGTTFTGAQSISPSAPASATLYGSIMLPGYRRAAGTAHAALASLTSNNSATWFDAFTSTGRYIVWRMSAGIQAIRITPSTASTFDAGSITLLGK